MTSFCGKYEVESQENYEEFLEAIGLSKFKIDHKVITDVVLDGDVYTWTQTIPNLTWSYRFTLGRECELTTMTGLKFTALVTMEDGKISIPFPDYLVTAEIIDDKLVVISVTRDKGVTFKRVSRRI